jgi:hypothetical protein
MNDDPRIKPLMDTISKLTEILQGTKIILQKETDQRFEMCMTLWGFVVRLKNEHAALSRLVVSSPLIEDESERQKLLRNVAHLESECERLEHLLKKAMEPESASPLGVG